MYTQAELDCLDPTRIPEHIAIIPDGNRRWAKRQELSVEKGHKQGADILMQTLRAAKKIGVKTLTFYTFSTENWNRSESEVEGLMWLIESYLESEMATMAEESVRLSTIGQVDKLGQSLQTTLQRAKALTEECHEIELVLALNYGARDEMVRACRKIAQEVAMGQIQPQDIDEATLSRRLDTYLWKDPDLLIRTSGECRLSNFLLWQLSYAEIYLSSVYWPDFTPQHLLEAVLSYQERDRRLGE